MLIRRAVVASPGASDARPVSDGLLGGACGANDARRVKDGRPVSDGRPIGGSPPWSKVDVEENTCRCAPPLAAVSQAFTFAAKRKEHSVSLALSGSGLMLTNISVLPEPPRQGCSR